MDYGYLDEDANNGKDALLDSKILKGGKDVPETNEGG